MAMRVSVLPSPDHQMVCVLCYFIFFICFSFSRMFIQFVIGCWDWTSYLIWQLRVCPQNIQHLHTYPLCTTHACVMTLQPPLTATPPCSPMTPTPLNVTTLKMIIQLPLSTMPSHPPCQQSPVIHHKDDLLPCPICQQWPTLLLWLMWWPWPANAVRATDKDGSLRSTAGGILGQ